MLSNFSCLTPICQTHAPPSLGARPTYPPQELGRSLTQLFVLLGFLFLYYEYIKFSLAPDAQPM